MADAGRGGRGPYPPIENLRHVLDDFDGEAQDSFYSWLKTLSNCVFKA
jgi:hypothetical protein